jgi:predicted amidohydrolase YtcJ
MFRALAPLGIAALFVAGTAIATPTLVQNVRGYTLAGDRLQRFEALVMDDGKVVATGATAALHKANPTATIVDGHGRVLLPGLIDAHGHVLELGTRSTQVHLEDTRSLAVAQARIRSYAKASGESAWVLGGGWNQAVWKLGRFPTAAELDAVVPDRPAALDRVDGHAVWLNSRALAAAGITRATPDPVGGRIEHDASGEPSGVLVDKAMSLVGRVIPKATLAERRTALKAALRHMNAMGLTSAGDAGADAETISLYRDLADHGELTARIYAMISDAEEDFRALSKDGPLIGYGHDRLTVRSVKLYTDGALGSRGAALLAPYSDQPSHRGLLFWSEAELQKKVETALRAGYQVNVHAIGDAGNRQILDAFEHAYATVGGRQLRNRIEHAQIVAPEDIPRFKQLDLIASMQATHATSDMNMAEDRLGRDRLKGAYAWRTFLDQGTRVAGGSDFPVESDNPFFGLHAAVTRTDHAGQPPGGWHREQAMTLVEAFRSFTTDAAYAQHQESTLGSLEPGKWADFIVVDRDPFTISPGLLWRVRVLQTWVAGQRVY